jgi:hypothetical protein
MSVSYLKVIRVLLASVYNLKYPNKGGLALDVFMQDFFKSANNVQRRLPNKYQEVWDPEIVITYVKKTWLRNEDLDIRQLQQRTLIILCLATM